MFGLLNEIKSPRLGYESKKWAQFIPRSTTTYERFIRDAYNAAWTPAGPQPRIATSNKVPSLLSGGGEEQKSADAGGVLVPQGQTDDTLGISASRIEHSTTGTATTRDIIVGGLAIVPAA